MQPLVFAKVLTMNRNRDKGQVLVELALALTLLTLLVFGAFEFGRAMYVKNSLNLAAREGARRASVCDPLDTAAVESRAIGCLPSSLQSGAVVSVTPATPQHGIDSVTVTVSIPFTSVVPLLFAPLENLTLRGEASMRYE